VLTAALQPHPGQREEQVPKIPGGCWVRALEAIIMIS
jgi:hypothetical protein